MIAFDTNILVYGHREETAGHAQAVTRLKGAAEGSTPWAIPVFCLGEFLRVVTHPRIFHPASSLEDAVAFLDALLESPTVRLLQPGERYWELLKEICHAGSARGNLIFDAQIAALLREHGVEAILTADRDFARFPRLKIVPLE